MRTAARLSANAPTQSYRGDTATVPSRWTAPHKPPGNVHIANGKVKGLVGPGRLYSGLPSIAIEPCRMALPAGVSSGGLSCASAPCPSMAATSAATLDRMRTATTPCPDLPVVIGQVGAIRGDSVSERGAHATRENSDGDGLNCVVAA